MAATNIAINTYVFAYYRAHPYIVREYWPTFPSSQVKDPSVRLSEDGYILFYTYILIFTPGPDEDITFLLLRTLQYEVLPSFCP